MKYLPSIEAIVHFIHKRLFTITFNDTVYTYDSEKGIYTQNDGIVKALINEMCRICGQPDKVMSLQGFTEPNLKGVNVYRSFPFDQVPFVIPFSNCFSGWKERSGLCRIRNPTTY